MAVLGSQYSKPNKTILLSNVGCTGTETSFAMCNSVILDSDTGRSIYTLVNVAGVKCSPDIPTKDPLANAVSPTGAIVGIVITLILLIVSIVFTIR